MCIFDRAPRSARRYFRIGMASLALALTSQALDITFGLSPDPLHFLRGLLIGVSIAANLMAVRLRRRPPTTA